MLNINYRHYLALLNIASKEETRYYLCGVAVQPSPLGGVVLIATDGHRFGAIYDPDGSCDESVIIRRDDLLSKAVKVKKGKDYRLTMASDQVTICDDDKALVTYTGDFLIDGTFPDWVRIWPADTEVCDFAVNPSYVADFGKVAKTLGLDGTPCVSMMGGKGGGPIVVQLAGEPNFRGLLMPIRFGTVGGGEPSNVKPDWFVTPKTSEQIAAE